MPEPFTLKRALALAHNTNIRIFAICMGVSSLLWLFQSMGREYTTDIDIAIDYENLPEDKTFSEAATNTVRLKVTGVGWDLLSYSIKFKKPSFAIDLSRVQNQKEISLSGAKDLIVESIPGLTNILNLEPDKIDLKLEPAVRKKVQIVSKLNVIPANGFGFSAAYPKPDSVEIFGPKSKLDAIKEIYTEEKLVENAEGELDVQANLQLPEGIQESSAQSSTVHLLMEPLTEKELQATIKVVGYKGNKKVNIFPRVATLKLQTTLSQFEKIDLSDFEVYVDFSEVNTESDELLEVKVKSNSRLVQNFRVHPKYVDYILEE
ncbi:hypothetical protein GC194_02155 [bacterium]|nr:hypothetical protein [bacterium]